MILQAHIGCLAASGQGNVKTYVPIPEAPAFGTTTTLTQAAVGTSIQSGELGGNTDLLVGSNFDQMQWNGITSTATKRVKDENWTDPDPANWYDIGTTGTNYAIGFINGSRHFEFYNIRTTTRSQGVRHDSPQSSNPPNCKFQNTFHQDHAGASFQVNVHSAGAHYGDWELYFVRAKNALGNEHAYFGNTVHEPDKTMFNSFYMHHCYFITSAWDGCQWNNIRDLIVENITVRDAGTADVAGQNRALQIENSFFYVTRSLFHSAANLMALLSTSGVIEHCFFEWTNNTQAIITDMSTNNHNDAVIDEDSSTTSVNITGMAEGDTVIVTTANSGLNYQPNQGICFRSSAAPSTDYFFGKVVSYSGTTLEIEVIGYAGSGSHTDWNIEGAIIFNDVTFYNTNLTLNAVFQVFENATNIFWWNCIFPNSGTNSVWSDSRPANDGYLIEHFGSTFTDTPNVPVYGDPPEAYLATWEQVVTDDYYYDLGWGHRTPAAA